jgi:tetrahydrodipicolinate N-succinyltransferase
MTTFDFQDRNGPVPAHRHSDGGGWVANTAFVDISAYVGPNARVFGEAQVLGEARVEGQARVYGRANVGGQARVEGWAVVAGDFDHKNETERESNDHFLRTTTDPSPSSTVILVSVGGFF